jgi:hypothetical protein
VASVLNGQVFVVHGGVDEGVSVDALNAIPRQKRAQRGPNLQSPDPAHAAC